ncbi:hypothetical protein [Alicyclobacillus acidocaldarius]|uniref:hypothetical protein n=1 Tax=Alicyclobacillus acidocaldarius TaxID=405212 RepID=UPI0013051B35|nr:hypothetical protein [Alicyclobacillus acidocaldarius]
MKMTRSHPVKGGDLQGVVFSDQADFHAPMETKREFADAENKQWVQERLLDYYHGSRG